MKELSRITETFTESVIREMTRICDAVGGYNLSQGFPDFESPKEIKDAAIAAINEGWNQYPVTFGEPELREAISKKAAKYNGIKCNPETDITVTCGATESMIATLKAIINPGDEIIVFEPAWPAYKDCAVNAGIKVRTIKTTLENSWEPSIDQIKEAINSNTKMIVLNYPNNPTGKILPKKIQDQILEIVKKHNLYVLSDEIYAQYSYGDWKSVLKYNYEKSIVTQSFSKSHAMTGFRIGYAIANPKIIEKMAKLQAICLTNVSEPIQYVALRALEADTTNNSNIVKSRLDIVIQKANEIKLDFIKPDGAMYLFARVKKEGFDGVEFSNKLLDHGLAVAPGEGFGDFKDFIRISACQDEKKLVEGMNILGDVLKERK